MKSKRVLVLAEYGYRNGGENSWLAIADSLHQKGWLATVATPADTELFSYVAQRFEVIDLKLFDAHGQKKSQTAIRDELASLIRSTKPDLVHCNSLSTTRLAGPVTAELNIPSLGYLRDILKLSRKAIRDLNRVGRLVAVSRATRDYHVAQGLDSSKCSVVYNGVDLERFKPGKKTGFLHRELNLDPGARLISCIGQIGLRKGPDVAIRSFLKLARDDDLLHLLLVGMRHSQKHEAVDYERHCHQIAKASRLDHRIHWLGRRSDVAAILHETTLLLHASRQEPLGRVLIESAACGCPWIATRVGGTPEIVCGIQSPTLMCEVDSPREMAMAAANLLACKEKQQIVSRRLREIAVDNFDATCCADQIYQLYCGLMKS